AAHPPARRLIVTTRRDQMADTAEPKWRHAAINRLVLVRADEIRFMPNADVFATGPEALVEGHPRRPVQLVGATRLPFQVLERPPVLHDHFRTNDRSKESGVWMLSQFLQ